ncbi:hypothetical protein KUM39_17985 [Streptomyces sp. J2-1]|uniref:hypothetical protein n=1 Tax=Streptomyces corallincola TaxID=2851888 RepID=UPI001C388FAB|nr:hypothetical protein [Streptomyces corallincola]MBV2356243.1 hypothetical protein [Streptomyces corallincola]
MRSARTLLATAAAAAALSFAVPGAALAASASDGGGRGGDSSHSKDHDSDSDYDKGSDGGDRDNDYSDDDERGGSHERPRGGMHTGGGALAVVRGDDWSSSGDDDGRFDPESYKDKGDKGGKGGGKDGGGKDGGGKDDWDDSDDDREKPRGGMHTGGGALAQPGVTAGGAAVLAVGAAGVYAVRRRKTS